MDCIKEAFQKVKQDIDSLKKEIDFLRLNLVETREKMIEMCGILEKISKKTKDLPEQILKTPTQTLLSLSDNLPTQKHLISTNPTHPSTHNNPLRGLKPQNLAISNGNQGGSTDRQTDTSTDRQSEKILKKQGNPIEDVSKILNSLDSIKKEIRLKFKRLTEQEILVFSTIYQLDEQTGHTDYQTLSKKLNLTESSIRDYVGRLIKKGIPVEKTKINNKNIQLSISKNLKKITTLSTILQLRDI